MLAACSGGHLADPVAGRLLQLMPPCHMMQLLHPVSAPCLSLIMWRRAPVRLLFSLVSACEP